MMQSMDWFLIMGLKGVQHGFMKYSVEPVTYKGERWFRTKQFLEYSV